MLEGTRHYFWPLTRRLTKPRRPYATLEATREGYVQNVKQVSGHVERATVNIPSSCCNKIPNLARDAMILTMIVRARGYQEETVAVTNELHRNT